MYPTNGIMAMFTPRHNYRCALFLVMPMAFSMALPGMTLHYTPSGCTQSHRTLSTEPSLLLTAIIP
ncbi:hypothetical protein EV356DRAFT_501834 [Viridothelium virens]|uniref:Uncharacterized protein n=1 Tax=Viridothelium virens TaxID=1048519 RepID=A0A6A6H8N6_VIRVR|nr:hypothetical protein EV356DRAFT_501834 [Viridothelium virens]